MKPVKKKDDSDYTVKIVIVGDSGVGKTNILCRFCKGEFKNNYVSTIGVDFKNMVIPVRNSKIRLQIWDTAGQERFKNINQTYFKGAMAVVLTYSIVDEQSFDNVENWIKQIHEHSDLGVIKFLAANKSDLPNRKVSYERGKSVADKFSMDFMEVSAKEGTNINQLFTQLGEKVYDYLASTGHQLGDGSSQKRISLHKKEDINPEGGCKC